VRHHAPQASTSAAALRQYRLPRRLRAALPHRVESIHALLGAGNLSCGCRRCQSLCVAWLSSVLVVQAA
jgi:hypothetical protein